MMFLIHLCLLFVFVPRYGCTRQAPDRLTEAPLPLIVSSLLNQGHRGGPQ
jgi:hypothetical protein